MSFSSTERSKKILEQLQNRGHASIQELADILNVSTMTIHRDLNQLATGGLIQKVHGGAALTEATAIPSASTKNSCAMCGKTISERTVFIITLSNGDQLRACCAHCGLLLQQQTEGVLHGMTTDFLHSHMVSAKQAIYLLQSELTICCAPSVLSFSSQQEAERFQSGFGGKLANMNTAIRSLHEMMHANASADIIKNTSKKRTTRS